ncbi:hypothetical protein RMATCC62417_02423 [Rhizopus microsporus]|nr:hypothetical protein RMATCC62417_02423 [Rhizopus microsporus]
MKVKSNIHKTTTTTDQQRHTFIPYSVHQRQNSQREENKINSAYSASYNQACLILQAIQMNGRRRLSPQCVLQLATFVTRAWEADTEQDTIEGICKLMNNLLDMTLLCPEMNLNEALIQFCKNTTSTQSVSPSITLLLAVDYISRLKQKYGNIKGTKGCGQRLILVAYMMASKYMHVNLKSIINISHSTTTKTTTSNDNRSNNCSDGESPSLTLPFLNTVKDTLTFPHLKEQILPSPPTSPKAHSDSDPMNYHYFSPKKVSTTTPSNQSASILRMELEFLHFLNYDLSLNETMKLIYWAQTFDDELDRRGYSSGYEGDTD